MTAPGVLALLVLIQGIWYAITGLWPLLSYRTFAQVTGDKHDRWLVRTVAVLALAASVAVSRAGGDPLIPLAFAAAFACGDALALRAGYPRWYLVDLVVELGFAGTAGMCALLG